MEQLPKDILESINLGNNEKIELWLKGAFKEWLICTNNQVFIIKKGFMTGHTFGNGVFQMPYKNITGATVNYHLLSGYFEINAGGMQNTVKDYWSNDKNSDPSKAPNCVSINDKKTSTKFKEAAAFIMNKVQNLNNSQTNVASNINIDIPTQIKKLAELKNQGILTEDEFNKKKTELLSKM